MADIFVGKQQLSHIEYLVAVVNNPAVSMNHYVRMVVLSQFTVLASNSQIQLCTENLKHQIFVGLLAAFVIQNLYALPDDTPILYSITI